METDGNYIHYPVFYREIMEQVSLLKDVGSKTFVDCTTGEGGHSSLILKNFPDVKLFCFERDPQILEIAKSRLSAYGNRVTFINDNFSSMRLYFENSVNDLSGILYDFGISSYHFDEAQRGFTFREDQPLDMRLDPGVKYSAADVINTFSERDITDIFYKYGEERWSKKIAADICRIRETDKILTAKALADIVLRSIPKRFHVKNIHPATRIFQALRIYVNGELSAIEESLKISWKYLAPKGRIMAISFHSLEDRLTKNIFRSLSNGCWCDEKSVICACDRIPRVRLVTKKPVLPGEDELAENNRSRSAKLRICEKI
ncbi:MAG: 16S rRNA (cytosine(1402)-N(4))-methyltransferase RsmH [Spirochaetes bacterium]|nr:16S rRNA (cytosine(1402)-N(4))-methyltransferase RsmH [Spirochaetota bacterium]